MKRLKIKLKISHLYIHFLFIFNEWLQIWILKLKFSLESKYDTRVRLLALKLKFVSISTRKWSSKFLLFTNKYRKLGFQSNSTFDVCLLQLAIKTYRESMYNIFIFLATVHVCCIIFKNTQIKKNWCIMYRTKFKCQQLAEKNNKQKWKKI